MENAADASLSSKLAASKYVEMNDQNLPDDQRYRRTFVFDLPRHLIELWKDGVNVTTARRKVNFNKRANYHRAQFGAVEQPRR